MEAWKLDVISEGKKFPEQAVEKRLLETIEDCVLLAINVEVNKRLLIL